MARQARADRRARSTLRRRARCRFAEADFLLALRVGAAHRFGVYSHGFTAATVARFRACLHDGGLRAGLASLFGVAAADLETTLASAYGSVKTNPHRFDRPPAQLFPEKGAA